jgi:inorganic pyrophosphatase
MDFSGGTQIVQLLTIMQHRNLMELPAFEDNSTNLNVVVESPRGSSVKFDYNPDTDVFELSYIMPAGSVFPFEFGFIPSTLAEDGDPVDILVLMDTSTCVGCLLVARPIGVIEAEQTQEDKTFRNDRLVGVATVAHERAKLKSLAELDPRIMDEIEHFFISYNEMRNRRFKPVRRAGVRSALELVRRGMRTFEAEKRKKLRDK